MANYNLMPNEIVIKQSESVAHGGASAGHTGELILTNFNLIYVNKNVFGGVRDVLYYPLMQMQKLNGKPNAMVGSFSNGNAYFQIYMLNGASETFHFQNIGRRAAKQWVELITNVNIGGRNNASTIETADDYDENSIVGQIREVGDELKEAGEEFFSALGFTSNPFKKKGSKEAAFSNEIISTKCKCCSAPLNGNKGQSVKCSYCDTQQVL